MGIKLPKVKTDFPRFKNQIKPKTSNFPNSPSTKSDLFPSFTNSFSNSRFQSETFHIPSSRFDFFGPKTSTKVQQKVTKADTSKASEGTSRSKVTEGSDPSKSKSSILDAQNSKLEFPESPKEFDSSKIFGRQEPTGTKSDHLKPTSTVEETSKSKRDPPRPKLENANANTGNSYTTNRKSQEPKSFTQKSQENSKLDLAEFTADMMANAAELYELTDGNILNLVKQKQTQLSKEEHILRLKWTGACLDGGWRTERATYTPYPNMACQSSQHQLLWRLQEDTLRLRSLDHLEGEACLTCLDGSSDENCDLKVIECRAQMAEQKFFLHTQYVDYRKQRKYFSIHAKLHPNQCATLYTGEVTVDDCLFDPDHCSPDFTKKSKNLQIQIAAHKFPQLCYLFESEEKRVRYPCRRNVFKLQPCEGSVFQLFYVI